MRKGIALYLSALLLAALLSGCSQPAASEAAATPAPSPASTATPTPEPATPTPAPTEEPAEEYQPGERTDTDYTSTTLGLHFALPETMVMASDDEINQMMQVTTDMLYEDPRYPGEMILDYSQLNTVYEMMAIDVTNGSNVIVMSEKLPLAAMTVDQYIAAMEQQLSRTTMSIDFGDPEPYTLGSTEFTCLSYSVEANGARMNQLMLLKKVDDRMYAITISYPDTVELAPLLACFSPTGNSV